MRRLASAALVSFGLGLVPVSGASTPTAADYDSLQEHRLGDARSVPAGGLEWSLDCTSWRLDSGTVRLQTEVLGVAPGLLFEGRGQAVVPVPDRVELRQLRRFLRDPGLDELRLDFDKLVLRASGGPPFGAFGAPPTAGANDPLYGERIEHALVIRQLDVDARLLAALGDPDGLYWRADVRTTEHGWLTFTFDSQRTEEISLQFFSKKFGFVESWLALDRAEDRTPEGRPGTTTDPLFDLEHVEIVADLTATDSKNPRRIAGEFESRLEMRVLRDGLTVVPLRLRPTAEVIEVVDGAGQPLEFIRDHLGARSSAIDNDVYSFSLLVLPGRALAAGEELEIVVRYELSVPKFASGRSWYPGPRDGGGLLDRHTARLVLTTDDRHDLQAMGRRIEERAEGKTRTTVWEVERPAKMVTFAMQKHNYTETLTFEGLPEVVTVGDLGGGSRVLTEERIDAVAGDTVNAIHYFQKLLDSRLPDPLFYAALIPAGHGQAFPGFLHLTEWTTALDSTSAVERFRAHEVGHQWWGHIVGWHGYRDQWLSEGFAEYTALMFVEATMEDGSRKMQEAITAYSREVRGSLESAFSRFSRPGYAALTARGADRMGPIAHGYRASIGEAPTAYQTLAYYKGALVLHMLRTTIRQMTGSDDAFVAILRDFVRTHAGRYATTEDFHATVESRVPADWSWFFDQWVYGSEFPTYLWDHELARGEGGSTTLRLTVEQRDVTAGFKMLVPVEIDFGRNDVSMVSVWVDEPLESFELTLPRRPKKVRFNAGDTVIANVKKR